MKLSTLGIALLILVSAQTTQAKNACFLWFDCSHSDCRTDGCRSGQICSNNKPGAVSKNDPYTCRDENAPTYRSPVIKRTTCSIENCAGVCIGGACMMYTKSPISPTTPANESKNITPCINEKTDNPVKARSKKGGDLCGLPPTCKWTSQGVKCSTSEDQIKIDDCLNNPYT